MLEMCQKWKISAVFLKFSYIFGWKGSRH